MGSLSFTWILATALAQTATASADDQFFRRQVAPIFETRCVRCHSGTTPKGKLSLESLEAARAGGENGPAIVPSKLDDSLLWDMISGDEPEMPKNGPPLTSVQQASVKRWIEQGAHWPDGLKLKDRRNDGKPWWAFQPLTRPPVPGVHHKAWIRTPVDAFVLHQLEQKGLTPSPEADRRTLIRRLTFDLHGLPPTPAEVEAFLKDEAPDAYDRLVDRLLASPRYGERWARHWLDTVHYGDTHGYDKDKRRDHAWPYRDFLIRSLNEDTKYGRWIKEQVAGDVRFPDDPDATIATGFIAAGPWDFVGHVELREGTVEKAKTRLIDRDDMLANTMSTFVSLTVHCARCHDHKFDPITQADYYRLQAVFAGVDRGDRPYADRESFAQRTALEKRKKEATARRAELQRKIDSLTSPELAQTDQRLKDLKQDLAKLPAPPDTITSPSNGYHSAIEPRADVEKWVQLDLGRSVPIDEIRLVPARPIDFADTPGFGFPTRFRVAVSDDPGFSRAEVVADETESDFANPGDEWVIVRLGPANRSARYVRVTATRLWKRTNDYVFALGELEVASGGKNVASEATVTALDSIDAGRWSTKNLVDGFDSRARRPDLFDPTVAAREVRRRDLRKQIDEVDRKRQRIRDELIDVETRTQLERTAAELESIEAKLKALPNPQLVYAVVSHPPRPIHLLRRGDVEQPGEEMPPGALECVPGLPSQFPLSEADGEGARRAALADWLADPKNMLTWRSIVNRVWHYHFGRGIVDTPNDFGRNGSKPSHPELLDWLAVEFRDGGQSLKALHRLIVRSSAYRQVSRNRPECARADNDNRLFWRMNRQRLDAESLRDAVLSISGTLDLRMGGPAFELFRFKDDHSPVYDHSALDIIDRPETHRRTVYRFTVRSVPNPFLDCLDSADPNTNTPVRNTTITALQALALLNDYFMIRQAERFAQRLERQTDDPARRIEAAYAFSLGRPPSPEERDALATYAKHHGLPNACRLLFNTNEFLFID